MEFCFNFGEPEKNLEINKDNDNELYIKSNKLRKCLDHPYQKHVDKTSQYHLRKYEIDGRILYYLDPDEVSNNIQDNGDLQCLQSSDLQPGVYEGGLKVWECTFDLLIYLQNNKALLKNKTVLDLGCGAGMLGAYSFLTGADHVCFQDYNSEVIEQFTIPCVQTTIETTTNSLKFVSGDWNSVSVYFTEQNYPRFNLILSSETIYSIENYPKLLNILTKNLTRDGVALFAAKTHYFGVGGGTMDFCQYIEKNENFSVETVMEYDEGLSRKILKITKK